MLEEKELGWNDEIAQDGADWTPLPEGDYAFEVIGFARGRSRGEGKLPPCNMAILTIRLSGGGRSATVTEHLLLHTKTEWKLSEFFRAIGQKRRGERMQMNWFAVTGSRGRCRVGIRRYRKPDGGEGQVNEILQYYPANHEA